jgi:outer membrane biosynthesis protein TonB
MQLLAVDLFAMKVSPIVLLMALCSAFGLAQPEPGQRLDQVTSKEFLQQLIQDDVYFFISPKVAESLLTKRVEPVMPNGQMMTRVSGTVIIAFELTKDGKVRHAMPVSGPKLLRPIAFAAVRQWTFKPYVLNGEPIAVATSIPITMSNF